MSASATHMVSVCYFGFKFNMLVMTHDEWRIETDSLDDLHSWNQHLTSNLRQKYPRNTCCLSINTIVFFALHVAKTHFHFEGQRHPFYGPRKLPNLQTCVYLLVHILSHQLKVL